MAQRVDPATLPDVTDAHRRAAFTLMNWPDCSFDQAMANDTRRRVIEACAHRLRTREWLQQRRCVTYVAITGHAKPLNDAPGQRFWPVHLNDFKRAAAGDLDD